MRDVVKVTVVNFNAHWGDKEANLRKILDYSEIASKEGSGIVVFPEMALTGYDDDADAPFEEKMQIVQAEPAPGPATEAVAQLTRRYGNYVVFGMPERDPQDPAKVYNAAAIVGPDGFVDCYRKIHPYGPEFGWCTSGDRPVVFDTPWGPVGMSICFDTYQFPEIARYARAKGARLILNPTALSATNCHPPMHHTAIEANVLVNYLYYASADLCGKDKVNTFEGGSSIVGPDYSGEGFHYYAGTRFGFKEGVEVETFSAAIDLGFADKQMDFLTLYKRDPLIGMPDYRPQVYAKMMEDLLHDERWLSFYDEDKRPDGF